MLKFLVLSYSELLLITTHCSWIVNIYIYIYILTNSHFSLLFPLSLLSLDGCVPAMVVCRGLWSDVLWVMVWWFDGHGAALRSRCGTPGSWVMVVKCFTTYQTKDPILTNNYPLTHAYNLLRFFRVRLNFLKFNFIKELKIYSFWISELE